MIPFFSNPRIRRYQIILVGCVLLLSGAVIPSSWDPPITSHRRPEVQLPKHPWIALTFDDGPHPVMTERLLDVLRKENVPATFFVVGKMADRYPQLLQEIALSGHEIENHTYSHPRLTTLDRDAVFNELMQTRAVIQRLTGRDSCLFRPPGGDYNRQTLQAASQAGCRMVLWSVLTNDVRGVSQKSIYMRIMKGAEDGGIVLMHSGMKNTVDVLPKVITALRQRGFHFVTVSTLMGLPSHLDSPSHPPASIQTASPVTKDHNDLQ